MTEHRCDVAVIGAGPAGIAAAVAAAGAGRCVIVLDEARHAGGQVWRHVPGRDPADPRDPGVLPRRARTWLRRFRASGAVLLDGAAVVDACAAPGPAPHRGEVLAAAGPGPSLRVVAERGGDVVTVAAPVVVLATGARERFLPFPGWTLPGVTGAGGVQALLRGGLRVRGRRAVVAGSGPLLLAAAAALARAGAVVVEVAEQAPARRVAGFAASLWRTPLRLAHAAALRGVFPRGRFSTGTRVLRADGSDGGVTSVTLTDGRRTRTVPCDLLCTGYGLVPAIELPRLLGCVVEGGAVVADDVMRTSVPGVFCAGESAGIKGVDGALVEGTIAGIAAAGGEPAPSLRRARARHAAFGRRLEAAFAPAPWLRGRVTDDTVVCRCEDVAAGQVAGCGSVREARLAARAGMGPCQGRVCGPALQFLYGWPPDAPRVPVLPARIATLMLGDDAPSDDPGGDP